MPRVSSQPPGRTCGLRSLQGISCQMPFTYNYIEIYVVKSYAPLSPSTCATILPNHNLKDEYTRWQQMFVARHRLVIAPIHWQAPLWD